MRCTGATTIQSALLRSSCFLEQAWKKFDSLYALLTVEQQWDMHAFYQPTKNLSQTKLVEHRKTITNERPSLPAMASKSFGIMYRAFRYAFRYANGDEQKFRQAIQAFAQPGSYTIHTYTDGNKRQHSIRVTSVARPEPDSKLIARALLELARQQVRGDSQQPRPGADR